MSDMTKLDDEVRVIAEFGDVSDGTSYVEHGMAREIVRLRRILAALREPSDAMVKAVDAALVHAPTRADIFRELIRRAVEAAEQEASREVG